MQPYETLREILDRLRGTYCGSIGVEYMHIQDPEQKQWLQDRMEATTNNWKLDDATRHRDSEPADASGRVRAFSADPLCGTEALRPGRAGEHHCGAR